MLRFDAACVDRKLDKGVKNILQDQPIGEAKVRPEHVHERLQELQQELQAGQLELQTVQARETYLREMILRLSGAIQVLDELLSPETHSMAEVDSAQTFSDRVRA